MSKYNLNGIDVENSLVIDNTNGISINGSSLFNFPNKYKAKIGSSKYSYNSNINYKINDVDQGTLLSPKIKVFDTCGNYTHILQSNTRKILCICLGGGAGGTGGGGKSGGNESGGGGGGGGGGGLVWVFNTVNGGEAITVKVGNRGDGGLRYEGADGPGYSGADGGNSSCVLDSITLCNASGGSKGDRAPNNNSAGPGGAAGGGIVSSASSVIDSDIIYGLAGTVGENDPELGWRPARYGYGGPGGNGGTSYYNYSTNNIATTFDTIGALKIDNVQFLDANQILDPTNSDFTQADFNGTNPNTISFGGDANGWQNEESEAQNYGRGGNGGRGESRYNNSHTNGKPGKQGFVIIAEYV